MTDTSEVQISLNGYSVDQFLLGGAVKLLHEQGVDLDALVREEISKRLDEVISDKVGTLVDKMITEAFEEGVVVSEPFEEEIVRKPIPDIVRQAAHDWMNKPIKTSGYNSPQKSAFEKLAGEIVRDELHREATEMIKAVKADTIKRAQTHLSNMVAEKMFDSRSIPLK